MTYCINALQQQKELTYNRTCAIVYQHPKGGITKFSKNVSEGINLSATHQLEYTTTVLAPPYIQPTGYNKYQVRKHMQIRVRLDAKYFTASQFQSRAVYHAKTRSRIRKTCQQNRTKPPIAQIKSSRRTGLITSTSTEEQEPGEGCGNRERTSPTSMERHLSSCPSSSSRAGPKLGAALIHLEQGKVGALLPSSPSPHHDDLQQRNG